jgi:hypothetical protein
MEEARQSGHSNDGAVAPPSGSTTTTLPGQVSKLEEQLRAALDAQRNRCERLVTRLVRSTERHDSERAQLLRQVERLQREARKRDIEIKGLRWLVMNGSGALSAVPEQIQTLRMQSQQDRGREETQARSDNLNSGLGLHLSPTSCATLDLGVTGSASAASLATSASERSLPGLSTSSTAASGLSSVIESPLPIASVNSSHMTSAEQRRWEKDAARASYALHRMSVAPHMLSPDAYTLSPSLEGPFAGNNKERPWLAQASPTYASMMAGERDIVTVLARRATAQMEEELERSRGRTTSASGRL